MFNKVAFFVMATVTAFGTAAILGATMMGIGYLTGMSPAPTIIAASTVAIAAFSTTISTFALAASLFVSTPTKPNSNPNPLGPGGRPGPPPAGKSSSRRSRMSARGPTFHRRSRWPGGPGL